MRKMPKKIFALFFAMSFVLFGCDKLDDPYLVEKGGGHGPPPDENVRKILLEEFTGHLCPNCPEGSAIAHDLKIIYGEQLILISIHAGFFALPQSEPYEADYRTTMGGDLNDYFSVQSYPGGMVNRKDYQGNTVMGKNSWEPAIQELIDLEPGAVLEIDKNYAETSRELKITIHSEILKDCENPVGLCAVITESGIVSAQKNSNASIGPSPDWEDYEHNHLLRKAINGTWGDLINGDQGITQGQEYHNEYSITLNESWDAASCHVVAYLYNSGTNEIIQAEEVAVID